MTLWRWQEEPAHLVQVCLEQVRRVPPLDPCRSAPTQGLDRAGLGACIAPPSLREPSRWAPERHQERTAEGSEHAEPAGKVLGSPSGPGPGPQGRRAAGFQGPPPPTLVQRPPEAPGLSLLGGPCPVGPPTHMESSLQVARKTLRLEQGCRNLLQAPRLSWAGTSRPAC